MLKVSKFARAKKVGTQIYCPKCNHERTVFHFGWSALVCPGCKAEIGKTFFNTIELADLESDFDLGTGFCWLQFENAGEEYYLQACLSGGDLDASMCREQYKMKIIGDGGFVDGLCGEANGKAHKKFGVDVCFEILKNEMSFAHGIKFV